MQERATMPKAGIALSPEEQAWLAAHPDITFGFTDTFEPAVIVDKDGSYRGTLVDVLLLLNQRLGTDFKITVGPIPDMFKQVSRKELAGILSMHPSNADKRGYLKTQDYMNSYPTVFTRKGVAFTAPSDLAGKRIALIDNVFFSQNIVDLYGDGATLIKVKGAREGLERVKDGTASLFIGSSRNSYLLGKYQFFDLTTTFEFYTHPTPNVMAVRNDWPQLVSILNKGLAAISVEEIESIRRKWISAPEQSITLELTEEEQAWLKENSSIKVGIFPLPPYTFVKNGRNQGYLVDMMQLIAGQAGFTPEFSMQVLPETFAKVKSGQLHTVLGIMRNEERAGFMYFSKNALKLQMGIFARTSRSDIHDAASLKNKIIATRKGYGFEHVVKKYLPDAKIIRADDAEGMLRLVATGEADAAIRELHSGEFILQNSFMNNVIVKGFFTPPGLPATEGSEFAVSKKFPLLNSILNKAYNAIPESEKIQVWRKWFASVESTTKTIELTPEEQAWINHNHTVRIRAVDWPPYLIVKNNQPPQGIVVEYLKLIGERTGVTFKYEVKNKPFAEFLENMQHHQGPDMSALIMQRPGREQYLSFTASYLSSPYVIFTRHGDDLILDISGLTGKTIAVPRGFTVKELLANEFPKIRLALFDSGEQALEAVATGKADAYIGNLTVASHIIHQRGFTDLHVVAPAPFGDQHLSMGNRKDWPELTSILNKALASITEEEKTDIRNKYVALRYEQGLDKEDVLKWSLIFFGAVFGIIAFFTFWNRSLSKKVNERTNELEISNQSLSIEVVERTKVENALRENRDYLKTLMGSLPDAVFSVKLPEGEIEWANDTFNVFGYEPDECVGKTTEFLFPDKQGFLVLAKAIGRSIAEEKEILNVEQVMRKKSGEYFPADIKVSLFKTGANVVNVTVIVGDISERKQADQKLAAYQERLKTLASNLISAQEAGSARLARELHDDIVQRLAYLKIEVDKLELENQSLPEPAGEKLRQIAGNIGTLSSDIHMISRRLHPISLEILGLIRSIETECQTFSRLKEIAVNMELDGTVESLPKEIALCAYRILQESLRNIERHARATGVQVTLSKKNATLHLRIKDNGIGFDPDSGGVEPGLGIASMTERAHLLKGNLSIESRPGNGTAIKLTLPL